MTSAPAQEPAIGADDVPSRPFSEYYDEDDGTNRCFVCGQPRYELLYAVPHFDFPFSFYRCACGMIKQCPMPNERFFEWFFNSEIFFSSKKKNRDSIWGYYDYFSDEPSRLATSKRRYRKLQHLFAGRSLEMMKIGPSTGTFLHVANQHGHHAIGCDISNRFAEYARTQYGAQIDVGRFERMGYRDGQFDALFLFNVIENVPNLDEFLSEIQRTVKIGGYFVFNYVEMDSNVVARLQRDRYFIFRPPICYAFGEPVMRRLTEMNGFTVREMHRDVRHMHLEKILTLLHWNRVVRPFRRLGVHRIPFPIYAYPSRIVVAERVR